MVAVINYELGNLKSVAGAVEKLGCQALVSSSVKDLDGADKLILPGVGAFGDGMENLRRLGLVGPLTQMVMKERKPILGICLGAQLFAKEGYEFGRHQGLGWIDGTVVRLEPNGLRVPHVGWNDLIQLKESILFEGLPKDALFYYVHSYHLQCHSADLVIGECEYGVRFTAALQNGNVYATQFHPEKSQYHGLTLLRNFLEKA